MPDVKTGRRTSATAALSILLLACIGLAACGGSSSTTSSSANAASTGTASTGSTGGSSTGGASSTGASAPVPGGGRGAARFSAIRECMQKNGIALPQRTPGSGRPGAGGFLAGGAAAGGPQLPKGVTRVQYEAALKKCGGGVGFRGTSRFSQNPAFKTALVKYGECLRHNGVNISPPNTSGNGPIFDTKGIDTTSPQFKAATTKCRATLLGAFRNLHRGGPNGAGSTSAG